MIVCDKARALIDNLMAYLFEAEFVSAGLATVGNPFPAAIFLYASARPDVLTSTFGTLNAPPRPTKSEDRRRGYARRK